METMKLLPVEYKDKEVLRNLMEYYLYDFSEIENFDLYPHGRFEYKYLDYYWTEDTRFPFFIMVNDLYAGFILVRKKDKHTHVISEFFVMRKYRRNGIGEHAARVIFDRFPGQWELSQVKNNISAKKFWRKVIGNYTQDQFQENVDDQGVTTHKFSSRKEV